MAERTTVVFSCALGALSGVSYVEIGARKVWIHRHDGRKGVSLPRKAFTDAELADQSNALAFRAAELMAESLALPRYGYTMSTPLDCTYDFRHALTITPRDEGAAVYDWRTGKPAFVGTIIDQTVRAPL